MEFNHVGTFRNYVFESKSLLPPAGAHDPSWTPPIRRVLHVRIWRDGSWYIEEQGVVVATGNASGDLLRDAKRLVKQVFENVPDPEPLKVFNPDDDAGK